MQLFYAILMRPAVALASISSVATGFVDRLGVWGVAGGVFLNGLGVPGLSEVLVPLGGVAVRQGREPLWWVFVVAMVAQMVGLTVSYWVARLGGVALIERYGKYILISHRELAVAQRGFAKYGGWLVLVGAFVPGVQGFIGYAGGIGEMPFGRFLVAAVAGKLIWISGLLYIGMVLGNHLDAIDRSIKQVGVVVLAALVILIIWYVRRHQAAVRPQGDERGD